MTQMKVREPAVAGQFYPATPAALKKQIETFLSQKGQRQEAIGCMVPHAGYIYSGAVAARTLNELTLKDTVVLLGPNHTGYGKPCSLMPEGAWKTPLGSLRINDSLAKQLLEHSQYLKDDTLAHAYEHSLEVQLPLLQYLKTNFEIVPISFLCDDIAVLKKIGEEIASAIKESSGPSSVTLLASSDMTHYEPQAMAQKKDNEAIQAILQLDENKLWEKISVLNISMCGYAPVIIMLSAAKALGAHEGRLVEYRTSAEATGDTSSVVGYAVIIIS
jgi:AmmeMemoRadiSam system protein B